MRHLIAAKPHPLPGVETPRAKRDQKTMVPKQASNAARKECGFFLNRSTR
jgi:hypothetical protein